METSKPERSAESTRNEYVIAGRVVVNRESIDSVQWRGLCVCAERLAKKGNVSTM
jgi:hypothetical protein